MNWRWAAVAILAATAGCSALAGPSTPTESVTPAPVPTIESTPTPEPTLAPGLTPRGVQDPDALADAHVEAIHGRSYVWRMEEFRSTRRDSSVANANRSKTLRVEDERRYRYGTDRRELGRHGDDRYQFNFTEYAEGDRSYRRYYELGATRPTFEDSAAANASHVYGGHATGRITLFLDLPEATVVERERDGQRYYRVTGDLDAIPAVGGVTNGSVTATVTPEGFVRTLDATYRRAVRNRTQRVTYSYAYENVGNTTVERPAWVAPAPTATERTDDDQ